MNNEAPRSMSSVPPAVRLLRRRVKVSESVERLLAELAGLPLDLDPWQPIGFLAADIVASRSPEARA